MRALLLPAARLVMAGACLMLAACGFQPLYAGSAAATLENLTVSVTGDERLAYLTETALIERTGRGSGQPRPLVVTLQTAQVPLGISADGQATRVALNIRASYQLDLQGETPLRNTVTERIVFETPSEPYALISARTNAERRAAEVIADALVRDIAAGLQARARHGARPDMAPARPGSGGGGR